MTKEISGIKSPDEIFRNKKRSLRDDLRLAIYELPPDYFTQAFIDPNNAVLITEGEAGREDFFVYGRFKGKELQKKEGLSQRQPDAAREKDFADGTRLATFSLQSESDDEDEADEIYDRFAFCAWKSKLEGFEKIRRESLSGSVRGGLSETS